VRQAGALVSRLAESVRRAGNPDLFSLKFAEREGFEPSEAGNPTSMD